MIGSNVNIANIVTRIFLQMTCKKDIFSMLTVASPWHKSIRSCPGHALYFAESGATVGQKISYFLDFIDQEMGCFTKRRCRGMIGFGASLSMAAIYRSPGFFERFNWEAVDVKAECKYSGNFCHGNSLVSTL